MKRAILLLALLLAGCATAPIPNPNDPARYQPHSPIQYSKPF
jgi:type IV pilus biogenesis protein CpaD/CtpE